MHSLQVPAIIDFTNKKCKDNEHTECDGTWFGLGFKVTCSCSCHTNQYLERESREFEEDIGRSKPIEVDNRRCKYDKIPTHLSKKLVESKNNNYLSSESSEASIDRYSSKENPNDAR